MVRLDDEWRGSRLDQALQETLQRRGVDASVNQVRRALRVGELRVDGRKVAPGTRVRGGETVLLEDWIPEDRRPVRPRPDLWSPDLRLAETPTLLAILKPAGLPTLPAPRPSDGPSLLAAVLSAHPEVGSAGPTRQGGTLHRLDNGASGLVLFARDPKTRRAWRSAFDRKDLRKTYLAVCRTHLRRAEGGVVQGHIETTGGRRVRFHRGAGPEANSSSQITVLAQDGSRVFVRVETDTGKRHQVRVHLASWGLPIEDDPLYGTEAPSVPSTSAPFRLHGLRIQTREGTRFVAPVPAWWPSEVEP